jgi:Rod binding domain-containing protein
MDALSLEMAKASVGAGAPKLPANDADAAAREFEAVFIAQMFEQLFEGVPTGGSMGGGTGERIFRSLMIQEVGKQMAAQGGFGLGDTVKRELLALQEVRP